MHPDVHLVGERHRARELRARAATDALARRVGPRPARGTWRATAGFDALRRRLGWTLVEAGLRLIHVSGERRPGPAGSP
ncbi:hypothetical protein [Streptomyces sp. SBT349]|uniref:hypothetical protein n=1 Tax=Streptomyces sp. SBT349 TaxID=1580539 RepID=UPI00066AA836|nr:hypothetical protein [Streptomyces sp. SBT349]